MKPRSPLVRSVVAAIAAIAVFMLLWLLLQYLVLPHLPLGWQNFLVLAALALTGTVTILAGIAQMTGYSVKDIFVDRTGNSLTDPTPSIRQAIARIQDELYSTDSQLPHVLTLCLDLCQRVAMPSEYTAWIRRELEGYGDREQLMREIGGEEQFEEWMQRWARHRLVNTYVKFQYVSAETGRLIIEDLPFEQILVGYSLPQVIEMKQSAALRNSTGQFAVSLAQLDRRKLEDLQNFIVSNGLNSTSDIQIFFTSQGLSALLSGVRAVVASLLPEARGIQERRAQKRG